MMLVTNSHHPFSSLAQCVFLHATNPQLILTYHVSLDSEQRYAFLILTCKIWVYDTWHAYGLSLHNIGDVFLPQQGCFYRVGRLT